MNSADKNHSNNLCSALLALHHSGPNGFEGLLAIILGVLTGQTFRLASSGSQRGRDGDSAFDAGSTYFEGKRYRDNPPSSEVTSKLFDLSRDNSGQLDLWVLGATCEVGTQITTAMRDFSSDTGIGTLTLDWSNNDLGSLLIGITAANAEVKNFIHDNLASTSKAHLVGGALLAIDYFSNHQDQQQRLASLRRSLSTEELGIGHAKSLNQQWLHKALSDRVKARIAFGQPLAPLDTSGLKATKRPIQASLEAAFRGCPANEIFAVIGEEGVGKSWLTAQTWLSCNPKSLLIICPADDFCSPTRTADFKKFLIEKLIGQTGDQPTARALTRWQRRIKGWIANPTPENVRVTLVVDGLNQAPSVDWSRRLDEAAQELKEMGGCLVITTRAMHWAKLRGPLVQFKVARIVVTMWSPEELNALLHAHKINANILDTQVFETLRNPRVLSIAVDLLNAEEIERIEDLSVGRLMFEHMRKAHNTGAALVTGDEFALLLKDLAKQVITRKANQQDDANLFNSQHVSGLEAVASCRFFSQVQNNPTLYSIENDGLSLGLALWLIDALEIELRNGREPRERLAIILEPISALNETAEVVFLAMEVACLEEASDKVRAALLEHLVTLQNLQDQKETAFISLVKHAPVAFLMAAESVNTSGAHVANSDWLLHALLLHRDDPQVWSEASVFIKRWLSLHSLAPERMMSKVAGRDSVEEVTEDRKKEQLKIDETVTLLTVEEQAYLHANLIESQSSVYDSLHEVAFYLLAGKPLIEFVPFLTRWSFANSLTPTFSSPNKEFKQLIRFNQIDWFETRAGLLDQLELFNNEKSSGTGQWTIVEILRATGNVDDAKRAEDLAEWLTRDREKFAGWSLINRYCASDPCDPKAEQPENVTSTADKYKSIDPSKVARLMGQGSEDHFFNMARTGIARFHVEIAHERHRAWADDILGRAGFERRQGILSLLKHSATLSKAQAQRFISAGQAVETSPGQHRERDRDEWLMAQYSLYIGIPHLTPEEQLEAIAQAKGGPLLINLLNALRPASSEAIERVLESTLVTENENIRAAILGIVHYTAPMLTPRAVQIVSQHLKSSSNIIRSHVFSIAANSADPILLSAVIDSGWDARNLREGNTFEPWHGSSAVLAAAKLHLIEIDEALDRMSLTHYGFAARSLGEEGSRAVALRVEAALNTALGYVQTSELPDMTAPTPHLSDVTPPLISLREVKPDRNIQAQLRRLAETDEQFNERQERASRAFKRFSNELTSLDAGLILSDLTLGGINALAESNLNTVRHWLSLLDSTTDEQLRNLHHFAIQVAVALGGKNVRVEAFLKRLLNLDPIIRRVQGAAELPSEYLAIWSNADIPEFNAVCKERLFNRQKDSDIALEVLAALLRGKTALISSTVDELLSTRQPANICRALTISGFSDNDQHAEEVISRFEGAKGFIGVAQKAAKIAYMKNKWSRHWYEQMLSANNSIEFWQPSVLLTKIVDARFDVWSRGERGASETFKAFFPTVEREIERRIAKFQNAHGNKLFGDEAPEEVFLTRRINDHG